MAAKQQDNDRTDIAIQLWQKERPDLNVKAKAVTGRIIQCQGIFLEQVSQAFKPLQINTGEYAVLCTLRVSGKPYQLTPKQILKLVLLTSGGMSNLLERLEQKHWLIRLPDPNDRRGVLVKLTEKGLTLVEQAMAAHARIEQQFTAPLTAPEQATLAQLLKKLLSSHPLSIS